MYKDNNDIEAEIALFGNEADAFDNDEEYHSKNLTLTELMKKTAERSYYIDLVDNYSGKTTRIKLTAVPTILEKCNYFLEKYKDYYINLIRTNKNDLLDAY